MLRISKNKSMLAELVSVRVMIYIYIASLHRNIQMNNIFFYQFYIELDHFIMNVNLNISTSKGLAYTCIDI